MSREEAQERYAERDDVEACLMCLRHRLNRRSRRTTTYYYCYCWFTYGLCVIDLLFWSYSR